MSELRQDPITHDWVIISPERAQRPKGSDAAREACPFCAGNESLTPPTIDSLEEAGRWSVRAVPNRFPALRDEAPEVGSLLTGWRRCKGYGHHEVIVESPVHAATLADMSLAQVRRVLEMYARRFRALAERDGRVRQVVLFRNQGTRAGTSLSHPHAQIVASPVVAPEMRRRMIDEVEFFDTTGACGMCHVLERELMDVVRVVHNSARFVTLAPFASRVPYHLQIVPRDHSPSFLEVEVAALDDLALHLRAVLGALHRLLGDSHYNLVLFTPPLDQVHRHASHWFIEIVPRLTTPAGFELGSRIVVNTQAPELAAAELRDKL
jgi:UDPglucose--hexose-1-phosphate uridylyltransferase